MHHNVFDKKLLHYMVYFLNLIIIDYQEIPNYSPYKGMKKFNEKGFHF